ncbi:hypothetical protein V1514DRAFT_81039 [Lipomyces japonicus]|uniref:uncharacterized protein n=1 Tax=Lipomyces japonicus TaxID=56871 RepID=UPI0034CF94D9
MWYLPIVYVLQSIRLRERVSGLNDLRKQPVSEIVRKGLYSIEDNAALVFESVIYSLYSGVTYRVMLIFVIPYSAMKSMAVKYPVYGFVYFASHSVLWPPFWQVVVPLGALLGFVMTGWYAIAYPPTAVVYVLLSGPAGLITSIFTVFQQASSIYARLARTFFLNRQLRDLFDSVLTLEGFDDLVVDYNLQLPEEIDINSIHGAWQKFVNKLRTKWRLFKYRMRSPYVFVKKIILFLIGFIPIIGPIVKTLVNSVGHAKKLQARYFLLKGFSQREIRFFVRKRQGAYLTFGAFAGLLESIPIIGLLFSYTNTIGAALWATKLENKMRKKDGTRTQ